MDLEFRKWLTTHGIDKEEFENMTKIQQEEIEKMYNKEMKHEAIQSLGSSMQSLGCLMMIVFGGILAIIFFIL